MDPVVPTVSSTVMPPAVRAAGPDGQKAYAAALAFESELVQQMAQALASTAQDSSTGDGSDGSDGSDAIMSSSGDAGTSMYQQMLPDALTQGVTAAGGTGLAEQLWRVLYQPPAGSPKGGAA